MPAKTGKQVKEEALIIIDSYISGFEDKEKDSTYFDGYRSALKTIKELVEKIDVGNDGPNTPPTTTDPKPKKDPPATKKYGKHPDKVRYL